MWSTKTVRNALMFGLGFAGAIHEMWLTTADRPFVLSLCGTLMGLPLLLRADGK